jgi:hypothetical protein
MGLKNLLPITIGKNMKKRIGQGFLEKSLLIGKICGADDAY